MEAIAVACLLLVTFGNAAELGEDCSISSQCTAHAICPGGDGINSYTCICNNGYTDSNGDENIGGTCYAELGTGCSGTSECDVSPELGKDCVDGACACKTGWTDSNGGDTSGGTCDANLLGLPCSNTSDCTPITENSNCSSGVCECEDEYADTNGGIAGGACVLPSVNVTTTTPVTQATQQQHAGTAGLLICLIETFTVSVVVTTFYWFCF